MRALLLDGRMAGDRAKSRLVGAALGSLAAKVVTGGLQIGYTYAFAAILPEKDFAWFLLFVAAVTFIGTVGTGGAAESAVRFVGHALKVKATHELARTLSSAFLLTTVLSLTLVCTILPLAVVIASWAKSGQGASPTWLFVLAGLSAVAFALRAVASALIRGLGAITLATVFEGTVVNGLIGIGAAWMLVGRGPASLLIATSLFTIASVIAAVTAWVAVVCLSSTATAGRFVLAAPSRARSKAILVVGTPLLIAGLLGLLIGQMMIWLVASLGTPRDVAVFGLGWQLFQVVNIFAMVGQTSLGPRVVTLSLEERSDALARFLQLAATVVAAGTLAAVIVVSLAATVMGNVIVAHLSDGAVMVAVLLGLGRFGQFVFGVNTTALGMTGGERDVQRTAIICSAVMLVLAPLSFLAAGVPGVAASGAFYFLGYGMLTALAVRRRLGFWPLARLGRSGPWSW